jgi:hypothetical protein
MYYPAGVNMSTSPAFVVCLLFVCALGCDRPTASSAASKPVAKEVEGHDHDHAHGPHGGVAFGLSDSELKAEVVTSDANNLVRVFVCDRVGKNLQPVKAEKVVILTDKLGGKSFELKPVNPDANGLAAEYSLDDRDLKGIIGLKPTVELTIGGKTNRGEVEVH